MYLCISCSSDCNDDNEPPINENNLEFRDLKFYISDSLPLIAISRNRIPSNTIKNNSNMQITSIDYPFVDLNDGCYFKSDDNNFSEFIKDSIFVRMPMTIIDSEIIFSDSSYQVGYSSIIPNPYRTSISDTTIAPEWTNTIIDFDLTRREYNLNFELTYYNKKLQMEEKLYGIWTGYFYVDYEKTITFQEIKK